MVITYHFEENKRRSSFPFGFCYSYPIVHLGLQGSIAFCLQMGRNPSKLLSMPVPLCGKKYDILNGTSFRNIHRQLWLNVGLFLFSFSDLLITEYQEFFFCCACERRCLQVRIQIEQRRRSYDFCFFLNTWHAMELSGYF
jgi:hypothetical protein